MGLKNPLNKNKFFINESIYTTEAFALVYNSETKTNAQIPIKVEKCTEQCSQRNILKLFKI